MDTRLVGREREIGQLTAGLTQALTGQGRVMLVAGEAGAGKTTLVHTVLDQAVLDGAVLDGAVPDGAPVVVLQGLGVQGGVPAFGPMVEAFRAYLRTGDGAGLSTGPLADHLAVLLPELRRGPELVRPADRAILLEAIRAGLARIAQQQPTVIILDDLQWADDATLELLPVLARSVSDLPLLILGAFRSDELPRTHGIRRMRGELRRAGLLNQITLEPLGPEATAELLAVTVGPVAPSVSRAVFDRTDGVPFFVNELGAALAGSGRLVPGPNGLELLAGVDVPLPESVRDAVLLRAADMNTQARAAVMAAAVAGQTFDPEMVRAVADLAEWPDDVTRLGLVHEQEPGRLTFRHALIREAFYSEIPWTRRVSLHRAIAGRLEAEHADPAVVAEHWARGRSPERARTANLAAAQQFRGVHAYRDAARSLRQALDQWTGDDAELARLDVLEDLAAFSELAGDLAEATRAWREVADERRSVDDQARLGAAHRRLAGVLEMQGRWPEALANRDQSATAFTGAGLLADAAGERLAAGAHLRLAGSFRAAIGLLQIARQQARAAGRPDLEARIRGHEGNARARMGEGAPAVAMVRDALAMALAGGFTGAAADIYQRLADALEHAGDYTGAKDTYDQAFTFCAVNSLEPTAQLCLACLTAVLRQSGDWERAVSLCRQVIASPGASVHARCLATGMYGSILGLRGQTKRARPLLLESATLARQVELAAMEMIALWGLAIIDRNDNANQSATAHCWALMDRWSQTEDRHFIIPPLRWAATFFAETGDAAGARACAAALAQVAADAEHDEAMSALAHALGETIMLDGDLEQAAASFARALELLTEVDAPIDRIESQRRCAAALAGLGRREEAVDHLVAAHRSARRLEARPLVERLADDLTALGEQADRRLGRRAAAAAGSSATGGLTRRETEVVRLVATGRTNREIARELFLSPRTIESHVSSIVLKLNCRSRADAARRASELGLLAPAGETA